MSATCPTDVPVPSATPTTGISPAPWWKKLLTGRDNQTWDIGRISWAVCTLAVLALAAWHEWHQVNESIQQLGISLTAIATGHGIGIGMKGKTEPGGAS